jgi:maltose alpha-D-glucosyltransferase / alpha-amylase
VRVRIHGDLHLGQILVAAEDFVIIDFEGEPARTIGQRRIKRSPLVDLAGVLRSFDYAAAASVDALVERGLVTASEHGDAKEAARWWRDRVVDTFRSNYLAELDGTGLLPSASEDVETLLGMYLVEKAMYELRYELANRPAWVPRPLGALLDLLDQTRPPG